MPRCSPRRRFPIREAIVGCVAFASVLARAADEPRARRTVMAIGTVFDPRMQPLDAKVMRAWEDDGITFSTGASKGVEGCLAAYDAFPKVR